jgi:tetratricopeptide (TPR) repeat protein
VERKAWTKLVQDLEREASGTNDLALFISAMLRQGEIWAEELGEPRRAIACYERLLERDPGNIGALMALEPLYRRVGAWESLGHVYDALARVVTDPGARVAALRELARLQEHRGSATGGDPRFTYDAILQAEPDDTISLSALEAIALERGDRELLADVDRRLAESRDKLIRSVYLTRLAESLEAAGRPEAIDAYRAALEADPENLGATRGLSRIAENTGDPVALAEAARREANVATDGEIAAQLLVKSARVRTERLDDREGALRDLERALELNPDSTDAADDLSEILVRRKKPGRLADLLSRAAGSATKPDRVAALWNRVAEIQADALDNIPGAISSLNRVLRAAPNHVPTLRNLAELYNRDGQWTEAVNLLSRVVQLAPDREVLKEAHLALAALWDERLGESSRALVSLQAVLALDADNRRALKRLSELQEKEGKVDQAAETATRLVQASRTDAERAQALLHLASVEGKRGDARAELDALLSAVALEGPASESALTLKSLLETPTEWEAYDRAMQRFLTAARDRGEDVSSAYLELARVRQDQLQKEQGAFDILLEGIDAVRDPGTLRSELAMRLRMAGRHEEAIQQLRTLLYSDLLKAEAWRDLARNFDALRRPGESRLALMPLAILGSASDAEIGHLSTHPPRPAMAREESLTNDVLRALLPKGPAEESAGDLLAALGPGLPKLYPPDLEAFGLVARDRVTSRQGHPLRNLADRIASVLCVEEFELYVHRVRSRGLAVELSNPPSLLVPAQVAELPESQQVFLLARPLAAISVGLHPVEKLTPREVEVLLASACRNVSPGYGSGLTSEDFLADQAKRIHKALPRRTRKAVEQMAARYVEAPRLDFTRWSSAVGRVCQAIAALLADDLVACVEVMQRSERELHGLEGAALVRSSSTVRDLLRFWVSDAGVKLRKQIGMLESRS